MRNRCVGITRKYFVRILQNYLSKNPVKPDALSRTSAISKMKLFVTLVNGFLEIPVKESGEIFFKIICKKTIAEAYLGLP